MDLQLNPLNYPIINESPLRITALSDTQEHIPFLMMLIDIVRPKSVVELGTYSGETYCAMCQAVSSLSLNTGCSAFFKHSNSARSNFDLDVLADLRAHHDRLYSKFSNILKNQDLEYQLVPDASIDILSIVNMVDEAELVQIVTQWLPKMSRTGVVLLFGTHHQGNDIGSASNLKSVSNRYPCFEFIHQNGLLIMMVGNDAPELLKELATLSKSDVTLVRHFFEEAARNIEVVSQLHELQNLNRVIDSGSWKLMQSLQRARVRFIPRGSSKENLYFFIRQLSAALIRKGPKHVLQIYKERMSERKEFFAKQHSYLKWIEEREPDIDALTNQSAAAHAFQYQPLISFICIVSSSANHAVNELIISVVAQTYINWELLIVVTNDIEFLYPIDDLRLKLFRLSESESHVEAYNFAFKKFRGDYAGILQDCVLAPNFLFEIVKSLNSDETQDIIATDEDKITIDAGLRSDPWFKPTLWSPELLLSVNYLRTALISRQIILEVGELSPEAEGAYERELLFRCTELTNQIKHLPSVLVHRYLPKAQRDAAAELLCIEAHLRRSGIAGPKACFEKANIVRVTWPTAGSRVSIIIPTQNKAKVLKNCLTSLMNKTLYPDYEVILLDNGSTEPETLQYYENLRENPLIKIVNYNQTFNWSAANNFGVKHASGNIFLFLNNDVEILTPDWLEEMVRWAEQDDIGVVGAKLLFPNGTIQHANVTVGLGFAGHYFHAAPSNHTGMAGSVDWYRNYLAVTGACMMMRRSVYEEVGGFDVDYILAFSDVLICVQLWRKGYRIVYTPFARLTHHEGITRSKYTPGSDIKLAYADMHEFIDNGDPYFNPNLSSLHSMPTFANPEEMIGEDFARDVLQQYALKTVAHDDLSQ